MSETGPARPEPGPLDRLIGAALCDTALLPVLISCALVAGTLLACALLIAIRSGHPAALAGLVVLGMVSLFAVEGDLRSRRLGGGGRALGTLWLLAALIALGFDRTGLF